MATFFTMNALKHFGESSRRFHSYQKHCPFVKSYKCSTPRGPIGHYLVRARSSFNLSSGYPDIQTFYKGRNVLVTGVTGFLGKTLLEKLLRSCKNIGKVYVLIRPKKGIDGPKRFEEMLSSKIFDRVKEEHPTAIQKLVLVNGDITEAQLGLSEVEEQELIENVSIIFNSAAVVKFDEEFKTAILDHAGSAINLVEFCTKLQQLKAYIHVSTAYSNCNRREVEEIIYPNTEDPVGMVKSIQQKWNTDDNVKAIQMTLMKGLPNTYICGKALAETILLKEGKHLPIAIVRPSAVTAAWKKPFPGWVNSWTSSTGLHAMIQLGILRSMLMQSNKVADYIPVDVCANLTIAVAWYLVNNPLKDAIVYNSVTGSTNPVTWGKLLKECNHWARIYPLSGVLWYPKMTAKRFMFHHKICDFCFHYLPAICMDAIYRLMGWKPKMLKIYQLNNSVLSVLQYFTSQDWIFKSENQWKIWEAMSAEERKEFDFNIRQIDWSKYCEQYTLGIKKYMFKEDLTGMPEAQRRLQRLKYARNATYVFGILMSGSLIEMTFSLIYLN